MRLGIRRKLIATLILVGLLPLALSLVVVLGGGAVVQLSRIRASDSAGEIGLNCALQEMFPLCAGFKSVVGNGAYLSLGRACSPEDSREVRKCPRISSFAATERQTSLPATTQTS